jgi:hypothetical protein
MSARFARVEAPGLIGGGEQALAMAEGHQLISFTMTDKHRAPAPGDLRQAVVAVVHDPVGGQPGMELPGHIRHRGEGPVQHQGAVRPAAGQINRHRTAQRSAIEQDALRRHLFAEPVIRGVRRRVAALLRRPPAATAISGIIEDQHRLPEQRLKFPYSLSAMAQIAGVAMTVEKRPVRSGIGTPPGVNGRDVRQS